MPLPPPPPPPQSLIRHYLLSNTHRLTLHGEPDPAFHGRRAAAEAARLASLEAAMTPADLARVEEEAEALRRRQATPDSPAALACIPSLQLSDVPLATAAIPRVAKVVETVSHAAAAPLPFVHLLHEQPTAGIGYTSLYFDLSALPQTLLPLLPLFTWALTQCGAGGLDETQLAHRIGTVTGGVGAGTSVMEAPRGRRDTALPFLTVSGKALTPRLRDMGDLMRDVLLGARLDVRPRLLTHLRDTVAAHESGLVAAGHRYAASLLASAFTKAAWANDAMGGLGGFHAQRALLAALQVRGRGQCVHAIISGPGHCGPAVCNHRPLPSSPPHRALAGSGCRRRRGLRRPHRRPGGYQACHPLPQQPRRCLVHRRRREPSAAGGGCDCSRGGAAVGAWRGRRGGAVCAGARLGVAVAAPLPILERLPPRPQRRLL